jgi:phosphatidylglycerol:prolipoprotein diacylglycerol transferase
MKPTLVAFTLAGRGFALPSYGVAVTAGFAAGVWLAARQARRQGLNVAAVMDVCFWVLVFGLLGSRLTYVVLNAGEFARRCAGSGAPRSGGQTLADCTAALRLWDGGLVFYGGAIAAALTVALIAHRRRLAFGSLGDLLAPSLALGHVFGRVGCFLAGCCYGRLCAGGPCVRFPPGSVAYGQLSFEGVVPPGAAFTPPLYPAQLYEAAGELLIFVGLLLWRRRQRFTGELFLLYALAYAGLRSLIELIRGDSARHFVFFLSTSQVVSAFVGVAALALLLRQHRRLQRL